MAESNVYKILYQGQLPAAAGTLATVGAGKGWIIRNITIVNTDTVSRTYTLWVASGGAGVAAANQITPDACSLATKEMDVYDDMFALTANDTISGDASAATVVTITITGDEVTY